MDHKSCTGGITNIRLSKLGPAMVAIPVKAQGGVPDLRVPNFNLRPSFGNKEFGQKDMCILHFSPEYCKLTWSKWKSLPHNRGSGATQISLISRSLQSGAWATAGTTSLSRRIPKGSRSSDCDTVQHGSSSQPVSYNASSPKKFLLTHSPAVFLLSSS